MKFFIKMNFKVDRYVPEMLSVLNKCRDDLPMKYVVGAVNDGNF